MLIGIMGERQHGKDTVADLLVKEYGFVKRAFADPLREEVAESFKQLTLDTGYLYLDKFFHPMMMATGDINPYKRPYSYDMRKYLQLWGTEYRRQKYGEDYWVKQLEAFVEKGEYADIVVPDVRFPNEARYIQSNGYLWWVYRPGVKPDESLSHASEQSLKEWLPDLCLINMSLNSLTQQTHRTLAITQTLYRGMHENWD